MKLPIYLYGQPVLREEAEDITPDYPELKKLINDMWETMYASEGVGLAAPQIGKPISLIVLDGWRSPRISPSAMIPRWCS